MIWARSRAAIGSFRGHLGCFKCSRRWPITGPSGGASFKPSKGGRGGAARRVPRRPRELLGLSVCRL
jgi:hypothetical protein